MSDELLLPEYFKRPRYLGGMWLDQRTRWTEADQLLLQNAVTLGLTPKNVASTFGRNPSSIAEKARDIGIRLPREWLAACGRLRQPKKRAVIDKLAYPYIVRTTDKYSDLIAVNRLVSRDMPGREDVCQDILLAMWESQTDLESLRTDRSAVRRFAAAFRRTSFERSGYGVESMDAPLFADDGDEKSKYEDERYQRVLVNHDDMFLEEAILNGSHHRRTAAFTDVIIENLSEEEESLGVPAAFWRYREQAYLQKDGSVAAPAK